MSDPAYQPKIDPNSNLALPLLTTKLSSPILRARIVQRRRLVNRLITGMQSKLTLIVAPAGYGKTTLLAEWIALVDKMDWQVAWLTLDPYDNEPLSFWSYFIRALQQIHPEIGLGSFRLMDQVSNSMGRKHITPLLNRIAEFPHHFSLVLDDYHTITNEVIHGTISELIEFMPDNMHLLVASRETPELQVARLRARNQLMMVQAHELSFDLMESQAFFREVMNLEIDFNDLSRLVGLTEGWIAGLQMAALSIQEHRDPHQFVQEFSGVNQYILDYLTEEILIHQDDELKKFLLETSILTELSAPLCNEVLQINNSQEKLEYLERANLFLVQLDDRREWYRYHVLFTDLLKVHFQRLNPERFIELHRRACAWLKENGFPEKAVPHALAIGDNEQAADIVEACAMQSIIELEMIDVIQWINLLPQELVLKRPRLGVYDALANSNLGRFEIAEQKLLQVEAAMQSSEVGAFPEHEKTRISQDLLVIQAAVDCLRSNYIEGIHLAHAVLDKIPKEDEYFYGWIHHYLGYAYDSAGDLQAAAESFKHGAAFAYQHGQTKSHIISLCELARILKSQGRLTAAQEVFQSALRTAHAKNENEEILLIPRTGLVDVYRERNQFDLADEILQDTGDVVLQLESSALNWIYSIFVCSRLARYELTLGNLEKAEKFYQKAREYLLQHNLFSHVYSDIVDVRTRLWLVKGEIKTANAWSREKVKLSTGQENELTVAQQIAISKINLADGNPDQVLIFVENLEDCARETGRVERLIELLLIKAQALFAKGLDQEAFSALIKALEFGEPEGYIRIFADEGKNIEPLFTRTLAFCKRRNERNELSTRITYIQEILSAIRSTVPIGKISASAEPQNLVVFSSLNEPLSDREREVLALLVQGFSTGQVAHELMISVNTAKAHIKKIYQKLDVHTRKEAIERALQFDLLNN